MQYNYFIVSVMKNEPVRYLEAFEEGRMVFTTLDHKKAMLIDGRAEAYKMLNNIRSIAREYLDFFVFDEKRLNELLNYEKIN